MARRVHERAPRAGAVKRSAWSIAAAAHLLVAGQAGQDRQAGGVRRGPAARAQAVRAQVPDRAGAGAPAAPRRDAGRRRTARRGGSGRGPRRSRGGRRPSRAALDRRVARNRVGAAVGLVGVVEATRARAAAGATRSCTGSRSAAPRTGPAPKSGCTWRSRPMLRTRAAESPPPAGGRRAGSSGCRAGRPGSAARAAPAARREGDEREQAGRAGQAPTRVGLRGMCARRCARERPRVHWTSMRLGCASNEAARPRSHMLRGLPAERDQRVPDGRRAGRRGTRHAGRRIMRQIEGHKVTAHALTHAHPDHQGASQRGLRAARHPALVRRARRATRWRAATSGRRTTGSTG